MPSNLFTACPTIKHQTIFSERVNERQEEIEFSLSKLSTRRKKLSRKRLIQGSHFIGDGKS